jgi:monovalent cation/proton antiporter MnhG/PhaG subunit
VTLAPLLPGVGVVLLLVGLALATVGLVGLILKPNLFDQLHAAGLITGPGVVLILLASVGTGRAEIFTSAVLVIGFVLVTSSISTHVIARAGVRRYRPAPGEATPARADGHTVEAISTLPDRAGADMKRRTETGMRVVIAHDGSAQVDVASTLAAAIDWPTGTVIRLVRAADREPPSTMEALETAAKTLRRPGIAVQTAILAGDPADMIIDETATSAADLLITGSRRRGFVGSVLGSSAAGEIVDRALCPVLVARSTALRTVMLTTDGSAESAAAAEVVARWPIFDLARIHVVAVSTDMPAAAVDQRAVDLTAAMLMDAGREVFTEVVQGRPGTRIVDVAERRAVDLIVIGSRGRTGLGRSLLGSVAGDVLASASCSVMVVGPRLRRPAIDS